jgi:hypothetical protein
MYFLYTSLGAPAHAAKSLALTTARENVLGRSKARKIRLKNLDCRQ